MSCDAIKAQIQKFDNANDFNITLYQNLKSQYNQLPSPFTTSGRPLADAVREASALETEFKKLESSARYTAEEADRLSDQAKAEGCGIDLANAANDVWGVARTIADGAEGYISDTRNKYNNLNAKLQADANAPQAATGATGATGAVATKPQTPQGVVAGASGATGATVDELNEVSVTAKRKPATPEGQDGLSEVSVTGKRTDIPTENPNKSNTTGLTQETREQAALQDATKWAEAQDWRVRLSLADGATYLYKANDCGPVLAPLKTTNGIIFPYTPSINVSYVANYDQTSLQHTNYKIMQYQNSAVESITIGCDFTAQSMTEANYVLAVIHFLRSVTKMFYGKDENPIRGTPPPLCYLTGLGQYNFNAHPLVITGFTYSLPTDVDYIRAVPTNVPPRNNSQTQQNSRIDTTPGSAGAGGLPNPPNWAAGSTVPTMVPTKINIQISASPIVARNTISNEFSLRDYATGRLLLGSNKTGGGLW
jgi:hypothetical protein